MHVSRTIVVGVGIIAVALSGCGAASPTTGVLTGRVEACVLHVASQPITVTVYARERLVATQRVPYGGRFRFSLPAGRYLVKDATGSSSVAVSRGRTERVPEIFCN